MQVLVSKLNAVDQWAVYNYLRHAARPNSHGAAGITVDLCMEWEKLRLQLFPKAQPQMIDINELGKHDIEITTDLSQILVE